jgi:hypothetical protein
VGLSQGPPVWGGRAVVFDERFDDLGLIEICDADYFRDNQPGATVVEEGDWLIE